MPQGQLYQRTELLMKTKISKRKFYNKFDYKVTLKIEGCGSLRYHTISNSKNWLEDGTLPKFYLSDRVKLAVLQNKDLLICLCDVLLNYNGDSWQKRIEGDSIDVYTSNRDLVKQLQTNLQEKVTCIFEPSESAVEPGTMNVKKLPDGIYNYRVYLLPHKLHDNLEKEKYVSWLKNQQKKIKITESVENWFYKTQWNWDPRYVLVDEESTLLMLKLRNPELVGRVYKFIIN